MRIVPFIMSLGLLVWIQLPGLAESADSTPVQTPLFSQWMVGESYLEGRQYDARLDQPVRFWGAGIPLKQVFASVRGQTGVVVDFFPPGDMNERVCVNLYLNPSSPPTLRELMAQLAWATDCVFSIEGDQYSFQYILLSTSAGNNAIENYYDWADSVQNERGQQELQIEQEIWEATKARLQDLRKALAVPQDRLIKEYQGVDDLLLLAMLDPSRRLFSEFMLTLSTSDLREIQPRMSLDRSWSDWTPEQQTLLRSMIEPHLAQWSKSQMEYFGKPGHWDDWEWVEARLGDIGIDFSSSGINWQFMIQLPNGGIGNGGNLQLVVDPRSDRSQMAAVSSDIELRQLLGEQISPEAERNMRRQASGAWTRARQEETLREQLKRQHPLDEDNNNLLASTALVLDLDTPVTLWQLQELVARKTGLHIFSDCFWQPQRLLKPALEKLYQDALPELTALNVLRAATIPTDFEIGPGVGYLSDGGVSWEWGDAGNFLHFRDYHRDMCREVFLPHKALELLNQWVTPYLPASIAEGDAAPEIMVPINPRASGVLWSMLTGPQRRYGWHLIYNDPTEWRNAYQHAFRESYRRALKDDHPYSLFGQLSDQQWERLHTTGLEWGKDVLVKPLPVDRTHHWGNWRAYEKGDTLLIRDLNPAESKRGRYSPIQVNDFKFFVVLRKRFPTEDHPIWEDLLPLKISASAKDFEYLNGND